ERLAMTMYQDLSRLKRKIVSLYIIAGIVILTFYMLQTVFVTNRGWMEVLSQHVPAQFLLIALATLINYIYTKKKLYGSLKAIESPEFEKAKLEEKVYRDIIEFPQKLFWMSFILYPMIISIKYVYEIIFVLQFSWSNLLFVALKYVSSSSLIYLYSQTLTIYLRRFLKPLLLSFNKKTLDSPATLTFKKSISMSGIFLFLIYFINIFVFEYFGGQATNVLGNLLLLTVITFAVFVAFLRNLIYEHVNNLSLVSKELLNIQDYDRRELHNHIPITSLDEIGVLTSSYN